MKKQLMALYAIIGKDFKIEFEYPELDGVLVEVNFKTKEVNEQPK